MSATRSVLFSIWFAVLALGVDSALGEAGDTPSSVAGTSEAVTARFANAAPHSHHEGEEEGEPGGPGTGKARGGMRKGTFSDSDGTGWNYCSGRCSMRNERIARAGGGMDNVLRIRKGSCTCNCVLFENSGPKLVKKIEVEEDSGYFNIGNDSPRDYSLRCCEED